MSRGPVAGASSGGGPAASAFIELTDVPQSYSGNAGKIPAVKTDESGLEFIAVPWGGAGVISSGTGTIPGPGTLEWGTLIGETDYPSSVDIDISGVTANSVVDINIDREYLDIAQAAGFCPTNESYEGYVRIYAKQPPSVAIPFTYVVHTPTDLYPLVPSGGTTGQSLVKIDNTDYNTQWVDKGNLLVEFEVTGSAVTEINFTGLDIGKHKGYRVEAEFINAVASAPTIYLYVNGDNTNANYYAQWKYASGTSMSSGRNNSPTFGSIPVSSTTLVICDISLINGYLQAVTRESRGSGSSGANASYAITKSASIANLTQLTLVSSVASAIAVGSRVRIYRGDV